VRIMVNNIPLYKGIQLVLEEYGFQKRVAHDLAILLYNLKHTEGDEMISNNNPQLVLAYNNIKSEMVEITC
jgi:hypothetical protein